jgi:hypothetical protein
VPIESSRIRIHRSLEADKASAPNRTRTDQKAPIGQGREWVCGGCVILDDSIECPGPIGSGMVVTNHHACRFESCPGRQGSVAQLDRAPHYGCGGWGFESLQARQKVTQKRALPATQKRRAMAMTTRTMRRTNRMVQRLTGSKRITSMVVGGALKPSSTRVGSG